MPSPQPHHPSPVTHTTPHTPHPWGFTGFSRDYRFEITVSRRQISRKSFSRIEKFVYEIKDFFQIYVPLQLDRSIRERMYVRQIQLNYSTLTLTHFLSHQVHLRNGSIKMLATFLVTLLRESNSKIFTLLV